MIKLFVGEVKDAPQDDDWIVARTAKLAIEYLFSHDVRVLAIGHKLPDGTAGYDVTRMIEDRVYIDYSYIPPFLLSTSVNPVERIDVSIVNRSIQKILENRYVAVV